MMNLEEFRRRMEAYRSAVEKDSKELRDSYYALERLHILYRSFNADERVLADRVLTEWVLSDDETLRFDALALVDDFKVLQSIPALTELAGRLRSSGTPGAPFELQKVDRIIKELSLP